MKFESKFGNGEIVGVAIGNGHQFIVNELYEVICILFDKDGSISYRVRGEKGFIFSYHECDLIGDPSFNQDKGCYPISTEEIK